jgi:hypothetical protein
MNSASLIVIELFFLVSFVVLLILYLVKINAELEKKKEVEVNSPEVKGDSDLVYLKDISEREINILLLEEIKDIMDLKQKITNENDIIEFSEKLSIRKKIVEEWIRLGEFSRLHGITQNYITILEKIGINSVLELSKQDPNILREKMYQVEKNIENLPSIGMIRYWVRNSEKIKENISMQVV